MRVILLLQGDKFVYLTIRSSDDPALVQWKNETVTFHRAAPGQVGPESRALLHQDISSTLPDGQLIRSVVMASSKPYDPVYLLLHVHHSMFDWLGDVATHAAFTHSIVDVMLGRPETHQWGEEIDRLVAHGPQTIEEHCDNAGTHDAHE